MTDYRSYRAPRENFSRLCDPELDRIAPLIRENRRRFAATTCGWMDIPLTTVRQWAQEEALVKSSLFTQSYLPGTTQASTANRDWQSIPPLILSGHQPELFHPGVWFKNFLLSELAKRHSGIGINILVDHDLARKFSLNVPTISLDGLLHKESISIDEDHPLWPWEHTRVQDLSKWKAFSSSVVARLTTVGIEHPLLCELWPNVIEALELGCPLGEALSSARHRIEHANGLQTIELPFSRLTTERSFACFVGELLTRIKAVHEIYNAERLAYRLYHKIKNHLQPLPALASDGQWLESPFWVYSAEDPVRRALWVRRDGNQLRLTDRQSWQAELPSHRDFEGWYRKWCELKKSGISIRPRALTTTAFLRLAVADLFIHGIGGGKYDQITDKFARSLWDLTPPRYLVATATLHLPLPETELQKCSDSEFEISNRIRDWQFSPERLCRKEESSPALKALILEKDSLIKRYPSPADKPVWHRDIQQLNTLIRQQLDESDKTLQESLQKAHNRARERMIRTSREFSLAIFPSCKIVERLRNLCSGGTESEETRFLKPLH